MKINNLEIQKEIQELQDIKLTDNAHFGNMSLNDIDENSLGDFETTCTNKPWEGNQGGNILTWLADTKRIGSQIIQNMGNGKVFFRRKSEGEWLEWNQLYGFIGSVPVNTDFNNINQCGTYVFGAGATPTGDNKPIKKTGILEVMTFGSFIFQRYSEWDGAHMYVRGSVNGSWSGWTTY